MFIVIIYCTVRPERRAEFVSAVSDLCDASRRDSGNLAYGCYEDPHNPGRMTFVEEWQSQDAIDRHMAQPHTQSFLAIAMDMLAEHPSMRSFEIARVEPLL